MKSVFYLRQFLFLAGLSVFFLFASSCESDSGTTVYEPDATETDDSSTPDDSSPDDSTDDPVSDGDLSSEDREALYFMLEEEKLARDVYTYLGGLWNAAIFENITQSETQHVAAVETLLISYDLEYEIPGLGVFENPHLQELYDSLTETGSEDLEAALWVGATIEDLDILDLQEFIDATETEAIQFVFESLQCGSRNHLRAFTTALQDVGVTYLPQFISVELYESVINSSMEQCN